MPYCGITLGELIARLEKLPSEKIIKRAFKNAHSYRGFYEDLAFEPAENLTVRELLEIANGALGKTFSGWKGGHFLMTKDTSVWIANEGDTSDDMLGPMLLDFILQ